MILSNLLSSNVKKKRIEMIILYLKIVKKNNTMKLVLLSTVESNISLTNKNVIQMAERMK